MRKCASVQGMPRVAVIEPHAITGAALSRRSALQETDAELVVFRDCMFSQTGDTLVAFSDAEQVAFVATIAAVWTL